MKKPLFSLVGLTACAVIALFSTTGVYAHSSSTKKASSKLGYDVSWPQCRKDLPKKPAFVVVGINGGSPSNINDCLTNQLKWASTATGESTQPKIQLYINTANPGEISPLIVNWPNDNIDLKGSHTANPYGECFGKNDQPCSWQYGWERAQDSAENLFKPAAKNARIKQGINAYSWWIDVETMNTWQKQPQTVAQPNNLAAVEGNVAYFQSFKAFVGLYSTTSQWQEITGGYVSNTSNLAGLPNWRPSGTELDIAKANCLAEPLTDGGHVVLTQYIVNGLDRNFSCL